MSLTTDNPPAKERQDASGWREAVLVALIRRGMSITELAAELGRSRTGTSHAINHRMNSGIVADIAAYLDLPND